jgi:predicted RNA-binding Zn ribbon-like protein
MNVGGDPGGRHQTEPGQPGLRFRQRRPVPGLRQYDPGATPMRQRQADRLRAAGLVGPPVRHRRGPTAATRAFRSALALREAVYRIFSAHAAGVDLPDDDLNLLNQAVGDAMCHLCVGGDATGFHWRWSNDRDSLERVVWPVARSAGDLLVSEDRQWVRECASSTCSWLFLDTSRTRRRKWCDMSTCGNREKARRHYRRARAAAD